MAAYGAPGLLATGRRGHRARAGALGALGGLGLALLAVRATTAIGTMPDGTGSVTVTGWAGTGITLLTAGLLAEGEGLELSARSALVVFGDGIECDFLRLEWGQVLTVRKAEGGLRLMCLK